MVSTENAALNSRFLSALKAHKNWEKDKLFAKIVKKLEKGKNLNQAEFTKVYLC